MPKENNIRIVLQGIGVILILAAVLLSLYIKRGMDLEENARVILEKKCEKLNDLIDENTRFHQVILDKVEINSINITELRGKIGLNDKMINLLNKEIDTIK